MEIHVICCNDSVQFAVVEDQQKAEAKLDELRRADYERRKWQYKSYEDYTSICYWHIHTVDGV